MKRIALLALALGTCGADDCGHEVVSPKADQYGDCIEFNHETVHHRKAMTCRMLWCARNPGTNIAMGGPATLWCEEASAP